jgi:hypothetical protein
MRERTRQIVNDDEDSDGDDYVQTALERASKIARAIAERDLQTEESLQKVSDEISNIRKQNKLLYNQLTTTSNSQIDDAAAAMTKINSANGTLDAIKIK